MAAPQTTNNMDAAGVSRLVSFVNKFVEISLNVEDTITKGTVYTIDPVSQSVVLLKRDSEDQSTLEIILQHSIKDIKILNDVPDNQKLVNIDEFFPSQTNVKSEGASLEEITSWLSRNRLEFEVKNELIEIEGVSIRPPYRCEDCHGSNCLVLGRVQKILSQRIETSA